MKGQVSTEFLVIMAIGLVIALVLVYLLGGFAGMGAGTVQTQSMQAWGIRRSACDNRLGAEWHIIATPDAEQRLEPGHPD